MVKLVVGRVALVALTFLLTACDASSDSTSQQRQTSVASAPTDSCSIVLEAFEQGDKHYHAHDFAGGYKDANHALSSIAACDQNENTKTGFRGLALSVRAWNEHHLPQGNSMEDMSAAQVMLDTCVNSDDVLPAIANLCHLTSITDAGVKALWPYGSS